MSDLTEQLRDSYLAGAHPLVHEAAEALDAVDALHRTLTEDEAKRTKIGWDIRRTDGSRVSWCSCGTKDCPTRAILDGKGRR